MSCHLVKRTPGTDPSQIKLLNSMQAASFLSPPTDCWEKWRPAVTFAWLGDISNWWASAADVLLCVVVVVVCSVKVLSRVNVQHAQTLCVDEDRDGRRRRAVVDVYFNKTLLTDAIQQSLDDLQQVNYCFDDSDTTGNSADSFSALLAHPT